MSDKVRICVTSVKNIRKQQNVLFIISCIYWICLSHLLYSTVTSNKCFFFFILFFITKVLSLISVIFLSSFQKKSFENFKNSKTSLMEFKKTNKLMNIATNIVIHTYYMSISTIEVFVDNKNFSIFTSLI